MANILKVLQCFEHYSAISAFAPVANPTNCPWGQKAFTNYLGDNKSDWEDYDATYLVRKHPNVSTTILIDQ
ncbi:S-formylglutathione hydrolase-like, partial [Trifolium medium]|nr:S-formylglutathione hydrolase-like [Trifolium medium]